MISRLRRSSKNEWGPYTKKTYKKNLRRVSISRRRGKVGKTPEIERGDSKEEGGKEESGGV